MFYHQRKTGTFCFNPCLINTFKPSPSVVSRVPLAVALIPTDTTGTPSSTIIDQDAPSASTSPTTHETKSPVIHQGVEEQIQGTENAQFDMISIYKYSL
ncbi:hypothetical protein Tco_0581744 [Tanacetum coccineum]